MKSIATANLHTQKLTNKDVTSYAVRRLITESTLAFETNIHWQNIKTVYFLRDSNNI